MEDADDDGDDKFDALLAAVARIPSATWSPPAELDEYRMLRPLGRGGMGSVWLAEDRLLDRTVAIKFIAHAEPDASLRERFELEARAAARLAHPNVVTVHRFGTVAGRPYIVAEYIQGQSLDQLDKPVPWQRALELGIALARGLAAAHRRGIVHRDIKPANAILASDGTVKLVDFGLAKLGDERVSRPSLPLVAASSSNQPATDVQRATTLEARASGPGGLTAPGAIAGTPLYLAPEVRGGAPADRRSDVYQLGSIVYELLTARAPRLDAPADDRVPPLVGRVAAEASRLAAVVDRCLRADADERFASGEELREALERLVAPSLRGELPEGNPYRGLLPFDAEHRALFFGRGAEIRAVIDRLRADAFVLVTGDSGVGKSSLCRAGVLPNVVDGAFADGLTWTTVQLVPGRDPVLALASALSGLGIDEELIRERPSELPRVLKRALGGAGGVLVFVDQLEELVTLAERSNARAAATALGYLASGISGVRLLATARGDFLARLAELPGLELARSVYVLRSLTAEGARDAIVGPAQAKGGSFESEALVDTLVASIADEHAIELPLLAFTLAQLWDAREPATQLISAYTLDAIGGVRGAVARHADRVLEELLPAQRAVARKLLLRLVTAERTRSRRSADELSAFDPAVLDALVRARLVVVRGDDPPMYELAHERLIDGWPALSAWLSEANEAVAIHARLAAAVANWERLARSKEALWRDRQLADAAKVSDLTAGEAAFVAASRRAARWRRVRLVTAIAAVPIVAAGVWGSTRVLARRNVARHIAENVAEAEYLEQLGLRVRDLSNAQRAVAAQAFDRGETDAGEAGWATTRTQTKQADDLLAQAAGKLEAAVFLDTSRSDVRRMLADVSYERVRLAQRDHADASDLVKNWLLRYDDGTYAARLQEPAHVEASIAPAATLGVLAGDRETPVPPAFAPGSYILVAHAPGRATARIPVALAPGETLRLAFELPAASALPADFIYVPPGRFLTGSRDAEDVRLWATAAPIHETTTGAYLIARNETTYGDWIAFLATLPPAELAKRRPHIENTNSVQVDSELDLAREGSTWRLQMKPASVPYTAVVGESIVYPQRDRRQKQDWLRMPVAGVSLEDVEAYAAWLDRTGRVPRARVCTEREWDRAARGADDRLFPNGLDHLAADDANIDLTYGRREGAFGPDEIGSHPASMSPFGVQDMAGNVWEIVRTAAAQGSTGSGIKGGSYYTQERTAYISNHTIITPKVRAMQIGVRICADLP